MTLKGNTILKIKKWCNVILYALCQYLSTNKIWTAYKYLKADHYSISCFILPIYTHYKFATARENYEAFLRALKFHLVTDETIPSYKAPKSHVKPITYTNKDNVFDPLIAVVFSMSPKLGGHGPKAQDLVIYFSLG